MATLLQSLLLTPAQHSAFFHSLPDLCCAAGRAQTLFGLRFACASSFNTGEGIDAPES